MSNSTLLKVAIASLAVSSILSQTAAYAQTTTLRNPLIPGAQSTPPGSPAAEGAPPPIGDGATPVPVIPGMTGPRTSIPGVPLVPSNQVNQGNSFVPVPIGPATLSPPGVLGPGLTGTTPVSPSTPGADPGSLYVPPFETGPGNFVPALPTNIIPTGGLPGTGGYNTTVPKVRRGGQETHQWELRGRHQDFAAGSGAKGDIQDEVALTGTLAGFGLPYGVPTGNGFNKGPAGSNTDLREASIDLGGGMRYKAGGPRISLGSSVQDFGLSDTRNNGIAALRANQSTEFAQGMRRQTDFNSFTPNRTTSFGLPYTQFSPANVTEQKTGQLLLPTAVETNF